MLSTTTAVLVACDLCGGQGQDYETDAVPVFTDESAALAWLMSMGWQVTPGSKLTCRLCAGAMVCARDGHELGSWVGCMCDPRLSGHSVDHCGRCVRQFAWCDRCEHHQYRVRADVTSVSGAVAS
ncbi:hypothetical protein [Saccharothrix algeriensis]|uniref:Uncharacterized protein n=1 Tax=Saccharothrix algeriensis TaxID=173560 RepID=A0ABS2SBT1_9PSEU|nr:hypothetical protein [Saccharothrix algeriensis]MBM7813697.1 hypothetical protein [Saccharothrix algeriensis]